jgi:ABC-type transport system involved in multi-copper enzyme maturation permease subunit
MTVTPVVFRELRSLARQRFTYWLRACGVGAMVMVSIFFSWSDSSAGSEGSQLFGGMHQALFWSIWILLPLLCSDCISREKREGTLGLLFLTRLKGPDIVIAKGISHGLRALTLLLAVIPVLVIPSLMGGVTIIEAVLAMLINLSALCCAIAAGLLASAWSKSRLRAMLSMIILEFLFLAGLGFGVGMAWMTVLTPTWVNGWESRIDYVAVSGLAFMTDVGGKWPDLLRVASASQILHGVVQVAIITIMTLVLAVLAAGIKTRNSWQDKAASAQAIWFQRTFCTPVFWVTFLRRWMRRKLDRNPIGWLEQRTWSGRLVTWGWFAVIVSLYSALMTDRGFSRGYHDIQVLVAWLLIGSMCLSASGSFRRERQTGVLELLLVSPLRESAIIAGRLRGLWGQFLPSFVLLLGVWWYFSSLLPNSPEEASGMMFYIVSFMTLPVIGLYFSLRCRTLIMGFLVTVLTGLIIPLVLPGVIIFLWAFAINSPGFDSSMIGSGPACLFQTVIASMCLGSLHQRLKSRNFTFERTEA